MIDYHVHTMLCNHATGTMEAYVRAAVAKGLQTICFLDHLTLQEGGRHNAMHPREVPMYVNAARRLARQYRLTDNKFVWKPPCATTSSHQPGQDACGPSEATTTLIITVCCEMARQPKRCGTWFTTRRPRRSRLNSAKRARTSCPLQEWTRRAP